MTIDFIIEACIIIYNRCRRMKCTIGTNQLKEQKKMAKKNAPAPAPVDGEITAEAAPAPTKPKGQPGILLPNGVRRVDFIRNAYYNEPKSTRSEIVKTVNAMLVEAGREAEKIPFQIVFAATKTKEDPRIKAPAVVVEEAVGEGEGEGETAPE